MQPDDLRFYEGQERTFEWNGKVHKVYIKKVLSRNVVMLLDGIIRVVQLNQAVPELGLTLHSIPPLDDFAQFRLTTEAPTNI